MTARRTTEVALGVAMLVAIGLIVHATNGQGFAIDEMYYYGRLALKNGAIVHYDAPFSPEYLLAPFNGHLAAGGHFIYETVFATAGAHYTVFVVLNAIGICACAGFLFVYTRRRLGDVAALAPCLLILFLGVAREQFLWPFDLHSSVAAALGFAGLLALERDDRKGDIAAWALLTLSASIIEVGLAFIVGAALLIAMGANRWRRAWVVCVPLALYATWTLWARQFGQSETELSNIVSMPKTAFNSVAVVLGSFTGTNPIYPGSFATGVTLLGKVLAVVGLIALVVQIVRGGLPRTIWVWLAIAFTYWALLAIGDRQAESTRYLLISALLVVLIAADCFRRPLSNWAGLVLVALALLPLPANVDALLSGKDDNVLRTDIPKSRAEFAMLELARRQVDPGYVVSADPRVADLGGGLYLGIPAGAYLDSAGENGAIAYTLQELRRQPEEVRAIADAALAGALGLELVSAAAPSPSARCRTARPQGESPAVLRLSDGLNYLRVSGPGAPLIGLRRFAASGAGVPIARLRSGGWASLELPADEAEEPWRLVTKASVTACSISSTAASRAT